MTGVQQAIAGRDPWWWSTAMRAVQHLADLGEPFDAYNITELGVPDPDHPTRWGAAFKAAQTAGIIVLVGFRQSRWPSRAGGLCWVWQAPAKPLASATGSLDVRANTERTSAAHA